MFAWIALWVPGGIDIIDGEVRYEVARSLATHVDSVIRREDLWFNVYPGREGARYTYYRFPHSALGAVAVLISDLTGPATESRRQFFFLLVSPAAGALLAAAYFVWFRRSGLPPIASALWASGGVLCTPSWYYATSTFDDIIGTAVVVWAIVAAGSWASALKPGRAFAIGLLLGLALNCKEPLLVFAFAVLGALWSCGSMGLSRTQVGILVFGILLGLAVYLGYDLWKFPPGSKRLHSSLLAWYIRPWPGNLELALIALAVSPAAGVLWYSPTLPLSLTGLQRSWRDRPVFVGGVGVSLVAFILFIASISFFKGDPSWGPRYLTPAVAVLWLFAPRSAETWSRAAMTFLLACGAIVQLLALSVDPQRLFVERQLPNMFGAIAPLLYFDPANAHLLQRPREIREIWETRYQSGERFSPGDPTFSFPFIPLCDAGPEAVRRYKMLSVFRPWWASYSYVPHDYRAISRPAALVTLCCIGLIGAALLTRGVLLSQVHPPNVVGPPSKR